MNVYEQPFRLRQGRTLILAAGSGNDVAAALRVGATEVVAVDIDPQIQSLGARLHPNQPYSDPRVHRVVSDARAYFEQHADERFDVVCFGLLDSHAMFSSMSTLRLDNYVYTVQGIRSAWKLVKPDGLLSVSFCVAVGPWIQERLSRTIELATGIKPLVSARDGAYYRAVVFVVSRRQVNSMSYTFKPDEACPPDTRAPTDDWPFLYLRPHTFPLAYVCVLSLVALTALLSVRLTYGRELWGSGFNPVMFWLGAAFMLQETRMVTELSLAFGSTWIVNASVFAGVLLMVWLANLLLLRGIRVSLPLAFAALFLTLGLTYVLGAGQLNQLAMTPRLLIAGLLFSLPIGSAGLIFSSVFKGSPNPATALGSNLLGAVLGGLTEYFSMVVGLKAMTVVSAAFYVLAAWGLSRSRAV